jgi:RNA recognition motif 2
MPPAEISVTRVSTRSKQAPPPTGDKRTTLMLKNLPNKFTRGQLISELESKMEFGSFDFVYLPIDFQSRCNFGYAFVNLSSPQYVKPFLIEFQGYRFLKGAGMKVCEVTFARVQGLESNVNRLINSPILSACSENDPEDVALPLVFIEGEPILFRDVILSASQRDDSDLLAWTYNNQIIANNAESKLSPVTTEEWDTDRLIREMMVLLDTNTLVSLESETFYSSL